MIKLEGRGFKSHPGQSFPLSLCGPISICRANAHMVYGLKHQHFTSHSITTIIVKYAVQSKFPGTVLYLHCDDDNDHKTGSGGNDNNNLLIIYFTYKAQISIGLFSFALT